MRGCFGERVFGRYGFVDAFNPTTGWVDTDVIGIDVGITLLSAENLRGGSVCRWFMANPRRSARLSARGCDGAGAARSPGGGAQGRGARPERGTAPSTSERPGESRRASRR